MSQLTEIALFKACVYEPIATIKLSELNLEKISDPSKSDKLSALEIEQKKALKLYHMAWSGVTKYIRTVCHIKMKPVEFPQLGIFIPLSCLNENISTQKSQKLTQQALGDHNEKDYDVKLLINQGFLNQCGNSAFVSERANVTDDEPMIAIQSQGDHIQGLQHINYQAIAKVCDTDSNSIQLILKEIIAQLIKQIKQGNNVRLMFKIGTFISKAGELSWKTINSDEYQNKTFYGESFNQDSAIRKNFPAGDSQKLYNISVFTPSVKKSRAGTQASQEVRSYHFANPNPQNFSQKYQGVRDIGYKQYEQIVDPADIIKFGKKVNYEQKLTSEKVMEEHLNQMRRNQENKNSINENKKKQEIAFINHIKELEIQDNQRKENGKKANEEDFINLNEKIKRENQLRKSVQESEKKNEKYTFFPFISGDLIEQHRAQLGVQLKNDLQSYLEFQKSQGNQSLRFNDSFNFTDQKSTRSISNSQISNNLLLNTRYKQVKKIFDSDYVKPDENFRVLQDSNPLKNAVMKQALQRHERTLKFEQELYEKHLEDHKNKIIQDEKEVMREKENRIKKIQQFNSQIVDQMNQNAEVRKEEKVISKLPIASGFTPEPTNLSEAQFLRNKKKEMQSTVRNILKEQMLKRQEIKKIQKDKEIFAENQINAHNLEHLELQKKKKKDYKEKAKKHWEDQLSLIESFNQMKVVEKV